MGKVVKLGPGAELSTVKVGDRVGVKWVSATCGSCRKRLQQCVSVRRLDGLFLSVACLETMDGVCFNQKVSGYYTPGTFQQYVLGPAKSVCLMLPYSSMLITPARNSYVTPIPDSLESADAAPMLCAGVTTYAALRKSNTKSGQWIAIPGAGGTSKAQRLKSEHALTSTGGLGHIACQIASRGMALRVIGIDAGSKEKFVKNMGAEAFIDVTKHDNKSMAEEVMKITGGLGASAVIVCTASNKAYAQAMDFLRFGGTLVCVGMPEGKPVPIEKAFPAKVLRTLCSRYKHQAYETADGSETALDNCGSCRKP